MCKLQWVTSKVYMSPFGIHSLCTRPNVVYTSATPQKNEIPSINIYILDVFTEKLYSKLLTRKVLNYIPITTSSHATSKYTMTLTSYNLIGRQQLHGAFPKLPKTLHTVELQWLEHSWLVSHVCFELALESLEKIP